MRRGLFGTETNVQIHNRAVSDFGESATIRGMMIPRLVVTFRLTLGLVDVRNGDNQLCPRQLSRVAGAFKFLR